MIEWSFIALSQWKLRESVAASINEDISHPERRVRAPGLQPRPLGICRPGALTRRDQIGIRVSAIFADRNH